MNILVVIILAVALPVGTAKAAAPKASPCHNPITNVTAEPFTPDASHEGLDYGIKLTVTLTAPTRAKRAEAFTVFADTAIESASYDDQISTPIGPQLLGTRARFIYKGTTHQGPVAHVSILASAPIGVVCVDEYVP